MKQITALFLSVFLCLNNTVVLSYAEEVPGTSEETEEIDEQSQTELSEEPEEESAESEMDSDDSREAEPSEEAGQEDTLTEAPASEPEEERKEETEPSVNEELETENSESGEIGEVQEEHTESEPEGTEETAEQGENSEQSEETEALTEETAEEINLLPEPLYYLEGYEPVDYVIGSEDETADELYNADASQVRAAAAQTTYAEAKKAYDNALRRVNAAQAEVDKGTLGFFNSNAGTTDNAAAKVLADALREQESGAKIEAHNGQTYAYTEHMKTRIGKSDDATGLDNMKRAIDLIKELNSIRQSEGKQPLKVSDAIMAVAEVQANIEYGLMADYNIMAHSTTLLDRYYLGENLASYGENADVFTGWYYGEKAVKEYMDQHGGTEAEAYQALLKQGFDFKGWRINSTGHYQNIIGNYTSTGMGVKLASAHSGAATNVFSSYDSIYGDNSSPSYTIEEYEQRFNRYSTKVKADLQTAKTEAEFAKAVMAALVNVSLDRTSAAIAPGKSLTLKATVTPSEVTDKAVVWSSSDNNIASVDANGKVTAKTAGTAAITATHAESGKFASCTITVATGVTGVSLNQTNLSLEKGKSAVLNAVVSPAEATNKNVTWTSSNTAVATVDANGKVTGKGTGTATITVKTVDGNKTATCTVKVVDDPAACKAFGFCHYNGKDYWYEDGVRQAVAGDPKNIIDEKYHQERGREIYDPESDGWYWLDSIYDGAKATGKEVWMPYIYQNEDEWTESDKMKIALESDNGMAACVYRAIRNKEGKWVRYDENGKMLKGWVTIEGALADLYPNQRGNRYYYDTRTGLMAKGVVFLNGRQHIFDEKTGRLLS